jgi:hypothetical protein
MRKLIMSIATAGMLGLSALSSANAAPVPGFEDLYAAALAACTPPGGTAAACAAALTAYTGALVAAGIAPAAARASLVGLGEEISAGGGDAIVGSLLSDLLAETASVSPLVVTPEDTGGGGDDTGGGQASPN